MRQSVGGYRYGYNGKEQDNEVKGNGLSYDYGARMYDPRLGKFMSRDPKEGIYPFWSPYLYAANSPLRFIDIDGEGPGDVVVIFAGADLLALGGKGSAQGIEDYVKKNHTEKQGGAVKAFSSKYWGVDIKNDKSLDIATQVAYNYIKTNHNLCGCGKKNEKYNGKIIIYGYSFGGVLAEHLTERLKKDGLAVELLVTIDAANGDESDEVDRKISDNVKENLNIYQRTKSVVDSRGDVNVADNSKVTKVSNNNYSNQYVGTPGEDDYEEVEHSTIDEISQPRVNTKIVKTLESY
jgi:RHS repeat-associated protein